MGLNIAPEKELSDKSTFTSFESNENVVGSEDLKPFIPRSKVSKLLNNPMLNGSDDVNSFPRISNDVSFVSFVMAKPGNLPSSELPSSWSSFK